MRYEEFKQRQRNLKPVEKCLLATSLLVVSSLAVVGCNRGAQPGQGAGTAPPQIAADMASPEIACKSLVKAMFNEDETQIKRLTTAHGYSVLKGHLKKTSFNSYLKLANRIVAEWGRPMFWQEDHLMLEHREKTGLSSKARTVRPDEKEPIITLKRTPVGWKLDDYIPGPDRLLQRYSRPGAAWNLNQLP